MKRTNQSLLALFIVVMLAGCGGTRRLSQSIAPIVPNPVPTPPVGENDPPVTPPPVAGQNPIPVPTNPGGITPTTSPQLVALVNNHSFGSVTVGTAAPEKVFTIENRGTASATLSQFLLSQPFRLLGTTCPQLIPVGGRCDFRVDVVPVNTGNTNGNVLVDYNGRREQLAVLSVGGLTVANFIATSVNFGAVFVGTTSEHQNVTITNNGQSAGVPNIQLTLHGNFPIPNWGSCTPGAALASGASCVFPVRASLSDLQTGALSALVARIHSPNGAMVEVHGSVHGAVGPAVGLHRNLAFRPQKFRAYLPTLTPSEGAPDYTHQGQVGALFTFAWNSNCSIPLWRGHRVLRFNGVPHLRHMLSHGQETALTYDGVLGYACHNQVPYANRQLKRYYKNLLGGTWLESADPGEQAALRADGWTEEGPLGWIP